LRGGEVSAGKYVTQDVFVSTKQQIGGAKQQEYAVEYDIAPNWQIKSSTNPQGNSGVDIFWRKRY
jgi:autotransporter translocation and assembly factor TamB